MSPNLRKVHLAWEIRIYQGGTISCAVSHLGEAPRNSLRILIRCLCLVIEFSAAEYALTLVVGHIAFPIFRISFLCLTTLIGCPAPTGPASQAGEQNQCYSGSLQPDHTHVYRSRRRRSINTYYLKYQNDQVTVGNGILDQVPNGADVSTSLILPRYRAELSEFPEPRPVELL